MSQNVYSVSSLVHYIKESLDHDFNLQSVLIKGEISNFTNHRSGHWYFTLKDAKAKISCVMFASYASRSKFILKEGMKVIINASVSMYEAGGSIQLYVTSVQNDGLGDLFLQLEQVKQTLSKAGLFEATHKKAIPFYPMSIGVITARTGAAVQDILTTIARRWPICEVFVYPTLVQGVQATNTIIDQLLIADDKGHDVILLARGGGAIEDLWCFNEEALARCVYQMHTVIVSGVGHESDTTLVDYVSDARAATPTAGAELITPDIVKVRQQVEIARQNMLVQLQNRISLEQHRMMRLKESRFIRDPHSYIAQEQMKLAMHVKELSVVEVQAQRITQQLQAYMHQMMVQSNRIQSEQKTHVQKMRQELHMQLSQYHTQVKNEFKGHIQLLDAYSPLKILRRGYHMTYQNDHIIKSVEDVVLQEELRLRMRDGVVYANVTKKENL